MFWERVFAFIDEHLVLLLFMLFMVIPKLGEWLSKISWHSLSLGPFKIAKGFNDKKAEIGKAVEGRVYKLTSESVSKVMVSTELLLEKWGTYQHSHYRDLLERKLQMFCKGCKLDEVVAGCSDYAADHTDYHYYRELVYRLLNRIKDYVRTDMIRNHLVDIADYDPEAYLQGKIKDIGDLVFDFLVSEYEDKVVVSYIDEDGVARIEDYQRLITRMEIATLFRERFLSAPDEFMSLIRRIYSYGLAQARELARQFRDNPGGIDLKKTDFVRRNDNERKGKF